MSNFLAGITATLSVSGTTQTATISDISPYDTATNPPYHVRADFTLFRKIFITSAGNFSYIFSSFYPNDTVDPNAQAYIAPPYPAGNDTVTLSITGDGVYNIQLLTIPTYQAMSGGTNIAVGTYVWDITSGAIYTCIKANLPTSFPPSTSPTYWTLITEATALQSQVYSAVTNIVALANTEACYANTVASAICAFQGAPQNIQVLCKNPNLLAGIQLRLILDDIDTQTPLNNYTQIANDIAVATDICGCPNSGCRGCNGSTPSLNTPI